MPMLRALCRFAAWVACLMTTGGLSTVAQAQAAADAACARAGAVSPGSVAFYYGAPVPVEQLSAFDAVVVEPDSGFDPTTAHADCPAWFAYVAVGEVTTDRDYYAALPQDWIIGRNAEWASQVVDQDAPGWPAFFVKHVIAPLWHKGYRGFFLDTLDSYQLVAKTPAERARQEAGLVAVIRAIKGRYPDARLIFNRGFEILPQVHDLVYAVAFESLYSGWDQAKERYVPVAEDDRTWLLGQAKIIREQYRLPVIAIDYCAPGDTRCARITVEQICHDGLVPYVADGALMTVGVGPGPACAVGADAGMAPAH
jgi:hypothetical protein